MDEDFEKKDVSGSDDKDLQLNKSEKDDSQDSTGTKLNCGVNGHENADQIDGKSDGQSVDDQLDAAVEGDTPVPDTPGDDSNLEVADDHIGDQENCEEDGDLHGNRVEDQEDGDVHEDQLDTEVDDEMRCEVEEPEHGFPCDDEVEGDKVEDHKETHVDGDTNGDHTKTQDYDDDLQGERMDSEVAAEIEDPHGNNSDVDLDNVDQDDGYNISGDDPPFSSLTRVETNAEDVEDEEEESKLSDEDKSLSDDDNQLFDEDNKLAEDFISAHSPASLLEDQVDAEIDTPLAEDNTISKNKSDGTSGDGVVDGVNQNDTEISSAGLMADEVNPQDAAIPEECQDSMDVDETNLTGQKDDDNQLENETPKVTEESEVKQNIPNDVGLNEGKSDSKLVLDEPVENEKETNIEEKDVGNVQSISSDSQILPSENNKSILNICSDVVEEIINKVAGDVENREEEDGVEAMDVDEKEKAVISSKDLKPEMSTSNAKESAKHSISNKSAENKESNGVICLSSDEDSETVPGKAKPSSNGKTTTQQSSDQQKNKETKPSSTAADDEEEDIMVIEEASSAPARKPARAKTTLDSLASAKRCKLCKKVFNSADQLRKHVREAHGLIMIDKEQILRCRICSFRGIWSVFVKHLSDKHPSSSHLIKDVDKDKQMPCGICSFRGLKTDLDKHMKEKHPGVVRAPKKNSASSSTGTKVNDVSTPKRDNVTKSPYALRPRKSPALPKESPPKNDSYTATTRSPMPSAPRLTSKTISWTPKQSSMLVNLNKSDSNEGVSAEGVKKQKAFFEKLVVDGLKMGKRQIRLDVLLEKCNKTVFECGLCQQSFPNYLQVYFHQKNCLPAPDKSSRIIVYLPFETIMSQFLYKTVGTKQQLQCIHCSNRVSAQNVSSMIQALHLSVHVVPEVIIRTYYNGVVNNRTGHARQDSNKKAYSWDEVLKPVSVNKSSVVSSRNNNLDRYICTSGRLHQMESRHVLNDDLHDFGKIHSSSSDDDSEIWETTYRRRKYGKKKKKIEFLSPNSKQKQSLLASVNYKLTSRRQHEREQRMAKRERGKDRKRDDSDSDYKIKKPAPSGMQTLSFDVDSKQSKANGPSTHSWKRTSNNLPTTASKEDQKLRSLLTSDETHNDSVTDDSNVPLNEFGGLIADDNFYPEFEGLAENDDVPDASPEKEEDLPEEVPAEGSPPNQEVEEEPPQEPEEDLGPLLTEEDLAEYWRLFEDDEDIPTEDGQCESSEKPKVPETENSEVNSEQSKSISSLLTSLPRENDILDYYGGSKQPLADKSLIFMTTQHIFKYFTLMPVSSSAANFACNLRGCTSVFTSTLDMAAHLGNHFPLRVIVQDYPSTSVGHVVPLLTTKQVLQHYRGRKTNNDERFRYSCCYKRCNATSILDQSLALHLLKHFSYVCVGNILLRKADFTGHPLLSHYKCLRGARPEHSSIFQLTCRQCEFFVTTYIFKGKIGDIVEAELSAHALSHDVGKDAEEALRKMCRASSSKLPHQPIKLQDQPTLKVISKPVQKTVLMSNPSKTQPPLQDGKRTVSVTEPELLKKFGGTNGGWKCLVKHCGFLHRGVKDLFIFANHLRRHILGCKKIIVMKKKVSLPSIPNRIPQGFHQTNTIAKPKPPIDVVTIDDGSDNEKTPTKASTNKIETKEEDISKAPVADKEANARNVKVVLNKLPLEKIEDMKTAVKTDENDDGKNVIENNALKRKLEDDDEKSAKKPCVEESNEEPSAADIPNGDPDIGDLPNGDPDIGDLPNGDPANNSEPSKGYKRKREETDRTGDRKSLRLSTAVDKDIKEDDKLGSRESEEEDAITNDSRNQKEDEDLASDNQSQNQNDEKELADPVMEKLIAELNSTKSDPIILPITTVERFFKQEIQSNSTMNFTCLMCNKTGFKGKDFELVRHLESHIGKEISLKMRELQVKDTKDDDAASPKGRPKKLNPRSLVHHDLEGLRKCPDERIQLRFEEVENFYVKNVRLSRSKSELYYGVILYTCVECNKGDLKTEHLVKHLEDHVEKTIKLIRNPAKCSVSTPS